MNPKGSETQYQFEYLTEARWQENGETFEGASSAPASAVSIGNGAAAVPVSFKVEGLEPSTTYRFRVVATNDYEETAEGERDPETDEEIVRSFTTYAPPQSFSGECPGNESLRAGASAQLPDCRAWEQASPVEKNQGNVQGTAFLTRASENGEAISFESTAGIPGGDGAQEFPTYVARRNSTGWSTTGTLPGANSGQRARLLGWTPDFATVFDEAEIFGQGNSFLSRATGDGNQTKITPYTLPIPKYDYIGSSKDGSTVVFDAEDSSESSLQLTPTSAAGKPNVYAWNRGEPGKIWLAGVLPDGSVPPFGTDATAGGDFTVDSHRVTTDGSVFFNDLEDGQLYLRLNPTAPETTAKDAGECIPDPVLACTVHISATQKTNGKGPEYAEGKRRDAAGPQPARFLSASPDGSLVTFSSSEKLTDEANTGPEPDAVAIARAKADDGGEKSLDFISAFAREIAIDPVGEYVYWTDPVHGQIGRSKLDGSDYDESFISPVSGQLQGIAVVDAPGAEYIFWTDLGGYEKEQGRIGRAGLDGGSVNPNCLTGLTNPRSIAASAEYVYWTIPSVAPAKTVKAEDGQVGRADLNCNSASVNSEFIDPAFISPKASGDIAVDGSHIYFSRVGGITGKSSVFRADLDGKNGASIAFVTPAFEPVGIAVNGSHLFWTDPVGSKVARSDLDGTDASEEPSFLTEAGHPGDLAVDEEHVYWTANQEEVANAGTDIYQLDRESGELSDLALDATDENGIEVQGIAGMSADSSYVYFVGNGVPDGVVNSPNAMGEIAEPGDCEGSGKSASGHCNLYVRHGSVIAFVARLRADAPPIEIGTGDAFDWAVGHAEAAFLVDRTARVSASGRYLLFRSRRELTGQDNRSLACSEATNKSSPGPCAQFFRFDYDTKGVTCLTCDTRGSVPRGPARLASLLPPRVGAVRPVSVLSRNFSRDGSRFFFETPDALVAADTNGEGGCTPWGSGLQQTIALNCQDVYEWEAGGSGSCTEASSSYNPENGGCIYLISGGKSDQASFFGDAGVDGRDVFVFTFERLVGQDRDSLLDVYDARAGGGLASQAASESPSCAGDACRSQPAPPPPPPTAASEGFSGPGNSKRSHVAGKKHKKHRKHRHGRHKRRKAGQGRRGNGRKNRHTKRHGGRRHRAVRTGGRAGR